MAADLQRLCDAALQAVMMSNAGGAWDNTKKYIEGGAHGGKGSDCHKVLRRTRVS